MLTIKIESLSKIEIAAKLFLNKLKEKNKTNKCIAFYGEMGVGKTTFIKAICKELGVIDVVNSPTFSIINEYTTQKEKIIYHFDFYRIKNIEEIFNIGYEEYFYSESLCFIEWPEKIKTLLPENYIAVYIKETRNGSRTLKIDLQDLEKITKKKDETAYICAI